MRKRVILLFLVLAVAGTGVFLWKSEVFKKTPSSVAPQHSGPDPAYLVSLGDSVAAGAGLPIASSDSLASLCRQSSEAYPAQLSTNLATMLQTLHAHHPRKVVLNTYYPLLNDTDTCLSNRGITAGKIQWVNMREAELNATISAAAKKYGDQAVASSFSGHLLCDVDPWVQALSDPAPLHPTAAGQASIAARDAQAL